MQIKKYYNKLRDLLKSYGDITIAFSGGVDSSILALMAKIYTKKVLLVNAQTPFSTDREIRFVSDFSKRYKINLEILKFDTLSIPKIKKNDKNRCYYCKKVLMQAVINKSMEYKIKIVADGTNLDDFSDYRPGLKASNELGIKHPFIDAELNKKHIIAIAKSLELPNWNCPSSACLASRIPQGTPITESDLRMIEKAEDYLISNGFKLCRVRKIRETAKIEVSKNKIEILKSFEPTLKLFLFKVGFKEMIIDDNGYKQGSMNNPE